MLVGRPRARAGPNKDDDDLLVGVVGIWLHASATAWLDRRQDHLETGGHVGREEFVDRPEAGIGNPPALGPSDDPPTGSLLGEELGDRQVERSEQSAAQTRSTGSATSRSTCERKLSVTPARSASSRSVMLRAWRSARIRGPSWSSLSG